MTKTLHIAKCQDCGWQGSKWFFKDDAEQEAEQHERKHEQRIAVFQPSSTHKVTTITVNN